MDLGYQEILLNSEIDEIENLCFTNKQINLICQDDRLWTDIFGRDGLDFHQYPTKIQYYLDLYDYQVKLQHKAQKYLDYLKAHDNISLTIHFTNKIDLNTFENLPTHVGETFEYSDDEEEDYPGGIAISYFDNTFNIHLDEPRWIPWDINFSELDTRIIVSRLITQGGEFTIDWEEPLHFFNL